MKYYITSLLQKIMHKLRQPGEFSHVSWRDLAAYTFGQALALRRGPVGASLASYRIVDEHDAALDTPFGTIFVPRALDMTALKYLLRETFDPGHWHHFDTPETPVAAGDTVVDCGASEGLWALSVSGRVKKIYLIEPQDAFVRVLRKTFAALIEAGIVEICRCAAGDNDGLCTLTSGGEADLLGTVVRDDGGAVPLRRIDTLCNGKRVDFIKADVEGAEMDMLRGAEATIRGWMPKIAVTVYHAANDWRAMRDYVRAIAPGYRWKLTGMTAWGKPLLLHLWAPDRVKELHDSA